MLTYQTNGLKYVLALLFYQSRKFGNLGQLETDIVVKISVHPLIFSMTISCFLFLSLKCKNIQVKIPIKIMSNRMHGL